MSGTLAGVLQIVVLLVLLALAYRPLGDYMAKIFTTEKHWRVEKILYRVVRVNPDSEQKWTVYGAGVLGLSLVSVVFLYGLQRLQWILPGSFGHPGIDAGVSWNTAVSFVTNTNWQSYVPESTMGDFVQMAGLTVQNFVSAAVGLAVAIAVIRGFVRTQTDRLGNFWVDVTRGIVRLLLPISFLFAIVFMAFGVVQSFRTGVDVTGLDGAGHRIALAPAASQEAIKMLGTNGGGIFNANSAHPFENPNTYTDILQIFMLLVIPVSLTRTFGVLVGNKKQGTVLLSVMASLWGLMLAVIWWGETHPNGIAAKLAGSAMEGKETRFGLAASSLFANSTTGTSTGAVNAAHDSLSGLGGGGAMLNMLFSEMTPGGVGTGMYSILIVAVISVFIAGLMVGRTPEYLGKKLGAREITAASIGILIMPALVLLGAGTALMVHGTTSMMTNTGSHGFSEVLYAYASASNNNGSAFGGLTVTNGWFQVSLGLCMLFGRFIPIIAVLFLAGSLARQKKTPESAGTLPTTGPLFASMVGGVVLLVAALTFVPALALGPIAEALL